MIPNLQISSPKYDFDEWTPNPEAKNILKSCNLSFHDYTVKNQWIGTGDPICTDPENLRKQIGTRPIDLGIELFEIRTFDLVNHQIYPNDSSLIWTPTYAKKLKDCLTLSMPENLIKLGIYVISIFIHDPPFPNLKVYVHQNGLLFTNTLGAREEIEASAKGFVIPVVHEVEELLNYAEEKCEDSKDYIFNQCMRSLIQKVSITEMAKGPKNLSIKSLS